jgi:hypothetical protein
MEAAAPAPESGEAVMNEVAAFGVVVPRPRVEPSKMPFRIHRLVQNADDEDPVAPDLIEDAVLPGPQRPRERAHRRMHRAYFRKVDDPPERAYQRIEIGDGALHAELCRAVVANVVKIG